ncbi:phage head closure protein [Devosia sp. 63-57]|uniref:phage head closure protein n=1 Tax=Devosia sp. 63-57 TaxID=1895751 RepID=UPI000869CB30|nr:phage head closure protein [Devosia sp. 63-57]ODT47066.1 MAG: hypothetical protein ABS74_12175 [Pelagibacterium sp. SCN 63-126]ODU88881.1 MAG: hypothetical protein ABT14_01045 [Pelagibacterium sp. SCN 63-17]OJX43224.1 MAG: hypothetical protein BGO80_17700 [Devosia sp. 63-57]
MTTLDPGEMRSRIQIQRATTVTSSGFTTEVWHNYQALWSRVRYQSGREFLQAGQVSSSHVAVFSIRWRNDLKPYDRIIHEGKVWNITAIIPVGHKVGVDLHATSLNLDP